MLQNPLAADKDPNHLYHYKVIAISMDSLPSPNLLHPIHS